MKEILDIRIDIAGGEKVVNKIHKKVKEEQKSGRLAERRLTMEKELGLNKEIDPRKKALIAKWKREKEEKITALEKIEKKQKQPIIPSAETREPTDEERKIRIKRLKEYLKDLEDNQAHPIIANIETEKASVNKIIEKLEKGFQKK